MSQQYIYLIIICLVFLALIVILLKLKSQKSIPTFKYSKKPFLRDDEYTYYQLLQQLFGTYYLIFAQVRLGDIIEYKSFEYTPHNKIFMKSVDFLLVDKKDRAKYIVIELDGASHTAQDRMARDVFVNQALKSAGVPIYHQKKYKEYFYPEQIKKEILSTLQDVQL